jgi:GNAT superfamily N-acetyltransferase
VGPSVCTSLLEEDYHGRGIASRRLRHLAIVARDHGIATFKADTLAENRATHAVSARAGWRMQTHREGGTVRVSLTLPDARELAHATAK